MPPALKDLLVRLALSVLPVGLLYILGWTTFWGGFLFFSVAELIRWSIVVAYPVRREFRPLVEFMGIMGAPLFSLAILLMVSLPLLDRVVQTELTNTFGLYLCYIPYAFVTILVFPAYVRR